MNFINQNLNLVSDDGCEKYELLSMRKVLEHLVKSHKPLLNEVGWVCEVSTYVNMHKLKQTWKHVEAILMFTSC